MHFAHFCWRPKHLIQILQWCELVVTRAYTPSNGVADCMENHLGETVAMCKGLSLMCLGNLTFDERISQFHRNRFADECKVQSGNAMCSMNKLAGV